MGQSESSVPSPPASPLPPIPKTTKTRDFDRCFILIGKTCSGKSNLGNLILGRTEFKVHKSCEAFGLTKDVQFCNAEIHPNLVYGEEFKVNEPLKIQVIDQPGCNDRDFKDEDCCEFMVKCIAESKGEMSANFIFLINLSSDYLSPQEFLSILNIAEILSHSSYSFFPNATIVFTHADKVDPSLNEDKLEQELRNKVKEEEFVYIKELLHLIGGRYIFVNGANNTMENRTRILRKLFQLTHDNLNVYVNGNNRFKGKEMKMLLGADPNAKSFKHNLLKYDVEYQFNPDLNLFRKYDTLDIGQEVTQALNKLSGIGKGVSVVILLVSLEEMFSQEIYDLICDLPKTYKLGEEFKNYFWNYASIIFKGPTDDEEFLKGNLEANSHLRELVQKVSSRYMLVSTKDSTVEECSDKILKLIKRVKLDTEGKTYIDSTVLTEMRDIITESAKQRKSKNKFQMTEGMKNLDLIHGDNPIFKTKTGPKTVVKANDFFWSRKTITPRMGCFILKTIKLEIAEEFKERYSAQSMVTTEEFAEFCLKAINKK